MKQPRLERIVTLTSFEEEERTRPAVAPDFDEFIGCLTAHGVDFVIVGAYALAFHGAPRFTGDLDVLIRPTLDNAERLLTALDAFGFPSTGLTREAVADRCDGRLGSHNVPFIGRESYLRNKRAAGRPKDLADIDALKSGDK